MLSKRDRQNIRRARLLIQIGDRAGAMQLLRGLEGAAIEGKVTLESTFRCDRLGIEELRVHDCLVRRSRIWPSGGRTWASGPSLKGKPAPIALACVGCPVGAGFAAQLPDFKPPKSTIPAMVLPFRATRSSRREDPMLIAAGMTPDDLTDWRA